MYTSFFCHLVDTLGPDDFLAPICMLLVDNVANRVARQNAEEIKGSLSLPISVLHHYSDDAALSVSFRYPESGQSMPSNHLSVINRNPDRKSAFNCPPFERIPS